MLIDWLNRLKNEIRTVDIQPVTSPLLKVFMDRFKRNVLDLWLRKEELGSDGEVYNRLNFEVKRFFLSDVSLSFNLEFFLYIDPERISAVEIDLSAEDLNLFLRSWQEGKTNRNLNYATLGVCAKRDMKEVLKDCGAELMDPRTTNLKREFFSWNRGGIYIRRNDGCLAVIHNVAYYNPTEDVQPHEEQIRKYLRAREIWNSENSLEKWLEKDFYIYIY
uniref:FBA_2 domain-containing protein n=1 Tax=Caenorhabditis tropicalis TaxID=1561998 RepID=A0A1I7U1B5_9PELO